MPELKDKLGMVHEREDGRLVIDPSLIDQLKQYEIDGIRYVLDAVPGVTEDDVTGMSEFYHEEGSPEIPQLFIKKRAIYRVVSQGSYTSEDILEPVTDLELAIRVLDEASREFKGE